MVINLCFRDKCLTGFNKVVLSSSDEGSFKSDAVDPIRLRLLVRNERVIPDSEKFSDEKKENNTTRRSLTLPPRRRVRAPAIPAARAYYTAVTLSIGGLFLASLAIHRFAFGRVITVSPVPVPVFIGRTPVKPAVGTS